jgi:cytosine/adenosine deaminase-related metal-dependent hydrolase
MTTQQYTQNVLVKNPQSILKNHEIIIGPDNTHIKALREKNNHPNDLDQKGEIIVPGFINLHCHLTYTDIRIASQDLFSWLFELLSIDKGFDPYLSALKGAREALSFGTTFLVENTNNFQASFSALSETGLKGLIGYEIFGSDPALAQERLDLALRDIERVYSEAQVQGLVNNHIEWSLSPHASYDVSPALWRLCLDLLESDYAGLVSSIHRMPILLTHLAESEAEEAWFRDKDSPLVLAAKRFWTKLNTLEPKLKAWKPYRSSTQYLYEEQMLRASTIRQIFTHLVQASEKDLRLLNDLGVKLVSCPRSNEYLRNGKVDIGLWERLGLDYGIGTDSKASNYDLDLRKEVNKLTLSNHRKFELLTLKAAEILGKDQEIGSLEEGKAADYVVLELRDPNIDLDVADPFDLIFDLDKTSVKKVIVNGKELYVYE